MGDIGCLSFLSHEEFLGAFGKAELVLTQDEELARKLQALRVHGALKKYYHHGWD